MSTDYCLFCGVALDTVPDGSVEHVFLSAIGGRLTTTRAMCGSCNNAFSSLETANADSELAGLFLHARNALRIVPGRKGDPPTIKDAGVLASGGKFDLVPGMIPLPQKARLPTKDELTVGSSHGIAANSMADARRALTDLKKKGIQYILDEPVLVRQNLSKVNVPLRMDEIGGFRCVAKTALTGGCVLFGNELMRKKASSRVRSAARYMERDIKDFVTHAYHAEWPTLDNFRVSQRTPKANVQDRSDFEHSIIFADVGTRWVAYMEFFGGYRFCVDLGPTSGLPSAALIVNPRKRLAAAFEADVVAPTSYQRPPPIVNQSFLTVTREGLLAATHRALSACHAEVSAEHADELQDKLEKALDAAGDDDGAREEILRKWEAEQTTLAAGEAWHEPVDLQVD